ncbi:MAG: DUF3035 domain-containing protein [Proteobacteria bacterium]|nr:DUF3035 domain-containing protein [Pseudomonadota bacterium]
MRQWLILSLAAASIILTGCDDVRKTLGLERDPPDEFSVVSRAPISLPPDFNSLPTPQTPKHGHDTKNYVLGAPDKRPQEESPQIKAQKTILGHSPSQALSQKGKLTPGEKAFIAHIDQSLKTQGITRESIPDVRAAVDQETHFQTNNEKTWVKELLFWQKDAAHKKEALNASEEYQKLHGTLPGEDAVTQ